MILSDPFRFGRVRWRICQPVPPSRGCGCCSITLRRSRIPGKPGRSPIRCARCCSWWSAGRSRAATITMTSSIGARRTCPSCAALPSSTSAFPARTGYVMNRINPDLFMACFTSWVEECWPDKLDLVAIDGKTSRRSHNRKTGQKALHLVSAFATNSRLVLGQEAVFEKSNEITAIPALIERLDLEGALVSTDAMRCKVTIAQSTLDAGADHGFIDLFWKGVLLVEQKSAGGSLTKAKEQALAYFPGLKESDLPRHILVS